MRYPVFKNVGKRSTSKEHWPFCPLSVISKNFEKLTNVMLVDHLKKCGLFSEFNYSFRSSLSITYLLTVVSDGIAGLLIGLGLLKLWHSMLPGF